METGYLIELKQSVSRTPTWYGYRQDGDGLGHTTDHAEAIRFARRIDAERVLADLGWTEAFVSEHQWLDAQG